MSRLFEVQAWEGVSLVVYVSYVFFKACQDVVGEGHITRINKRYDGRFQSLISGL